jgi:hypothetical protein
MEDVEEAIRITHMSKASLMDMDQDKGARAARAFSTQSLARDQAARLEET